MLLQAVALHSLRNDKHWAQLSSSKFSPSSCKDNALRSSTPLGDIRQAPQAALTSGEQRGRDGKVIGPHNSLTSQSGPGPGYSNVSLSGTLHSEDLCWLWLQDRYIVLSSSNTEPRGILLNSQWCNIVSSPIFTALTLLILGDILYFHLWGPRGQGRRLKTQKSFLTSIPPLSPTYSPSSIKFMA